MMGKMDDVNRIMQPKGITLGCRIGINSGLVVAGELGDRGEKDFTVMGEHGQHRQPPGVQRRSQHDHDQREHPASRPGTFSTTRNWSRSRSRGKSKPLQVYRVRGVLKERVERWERDTLAKSKAYVGRQSEWDALEEFMQGYFAGGGPEKLKVVGLRADGGMGKSRMVHEFLTRGPCPRGLILKGKTISYANAPYWVFVSVFKYLMGASEGDPVDTVRAKWEKACERLKQLPRVPEAEREAVRKTLAEHEEYLAYLLGVPKNPEAIKKIKPDELKEMIFTTFRLFIEAASALEDDGEAMYLVLDDLHWLDELSDASWSLLPAGQSQAPPTHPDCHDVPPGLPDFRELERGREFLPANSRAALTRGSHRHGSGHAQGGWCSTRIWPG